MSLRASEYIEQLQAQGRYHFTTAEALAALGGTPVAVRAALRRLKEKGRIADPHRGFHVIVPPEYRRMGCLPPEQFVPQLMAHLGEPYYAALLSAAQYHGAVHHRPQAFQVIVPQVRRPLVCGAVRVDFVARQDMAQTPTLTRNTPRGVLRIASPEATALELIGYVERCGGLDNVATVLAELAERLRPDLLAAEARRSPLAWAQRLGHLLCLVDATPLADALDAVLQERTPHLVPLNPSAPLTGVPRDPRWSIAVNTIVEPDL